MNVDQNIVCIYLCGSEYCLYFYLELWMRTEELVLVGCPPHPLSLAALLGAGPQSSPAPDGIRFVHSYLY